MPLADSLLSEHNVVALGVQGAQLMAKYGINVPDGVPVFKLDEVHNAATAMADENNEVRAFMLGLQNRATHPPFQPQPPLLMQVVVKSQILAGGRGLGHFTNGLKGGVHIGSVDKALSLAKQMLGQTLVTKQTGPSGKPVNTLYLARKMKLKREMYLAILLDRSTAGPVLIGCR
jgi:succinyl-CoA synthetase beta subunit